MHIPREFSANISSIGKAGQLKLSRARVGIAGLGGVGGIAFQLLVRAGVGRLRIADGGFFEESNANRQLLWSREWDGRKKTDAAANFAKSANPTCKIDSSGDVSQSNSRRFASGCSAVIDATDRAHSRVAVWRGCKKPGIPYVFASARGSQGMFTIFRGQDFEKEFSLSQSRLSGFPPCDHALGPVANAIGCVAAQQALNVILGKPLVLFPRILSVDFLSEEPFSIHAF